MVIDPVCGAQFDAADAIAQSQYQGKTYYFSATECKDRFEEDPERYVGDYVGEHGHHNHPMGDRNTSIAARTPNTVVGGSDYDNERMQDHVAGRNKGTKRTSLSDGEPSEDEELRH